MIFFLRVNFTLAMLDGEAGCQVNLFQLIALFPLLPLDPYISRGQEHCRIYERGVLSIRPLGYSTCQPCVLVLVKQFKMSCLMFFSHSKLCVVASVSLIDTAELSHHLAGSSCNGNQHLNANFSCWFLLQPGSPSALLQRWETCSCM